MSTDTTATPAVETATGPVMSGGRRAALIVLRTLSFLAAVGLVLYVLLFALIGYALTDGQASGVLWVLFLFGAAGTIWHAIALIVLMVRGERRWLLAVPGVLGIVLVGTSIWELFAVPAAIVLVLFVVQMAVARSREGWYRRA